MAKITSIVADEIYPIVAQSLDKNSNKFKMAIASFFNSRHKDIHDIAPYVIIYYNKSDRDNMFNSLGISEEQIDGLLKKTFFYDMPNFNPACAKDACTQVIFCAIRYFLINGKQKEAELTTTYLLFSGKFYASIYNGFWKFGVNRQVMDFVVNNMLSDKFDLKKEGSLFKAISKLGVTWLSTYDTKIKKLTDDNDNKILLQQLRDREKSFIKNISNLYYEANENKLYLNYETDSMDEDNFRLTANDSATAARLTESAVSLMTSQKVDLRICNQCKNANVKAVEVKGIIEAILDNKENISKLRRVINIIICDYMANKPKNTGPVGGADFIQYSMKAKPNTKNPLQIELKSTIIQWLDEVSDDYRRRKNRIATANNYYNSVLMYLVIIICKVSYR